MVRKVKTFNLALKFMLNTHFLRRDAEEEPSTGLGVSEEETDGVGDIPRERCAGCGLKVCPRSARNAALLDQGKNLRVDSGNLPAFDNRGDPAFSGHRPKVSEQAKPGDVGPAPY